MPLDPEAALPAMPAVMIVASDIAVVASDIAVVASDIAVAASDAAVVVGGAIASGRVAASAASAA